MISPKSYWIGFCKIILDSYCFYMCRWLLEAGNLPTFSHLDRDLPNPGFVQIRCLWRACNVNFYDLIYSVSFGFLFD